MLTTNTLAVIIAVLVLALLAPVARAGDTLIWVDHGDGHIDNDNHAVYALRDFPEEAHELPFEHDHLAAPVHEFHHGDYDDFHHDRGHEHGGHEHEHDLLGEHLNWLSHGHEHDRHHEFPVLSDEELQEFREFQAHRHHDW